VTHQKLDDDLSDVQNNWSSKEGCYQKPGPVLALVAAEERDLESVANHAQFLLKDRTQLALLSADAGDGEITPSSAGRTAAFVPDRLPGSRPAPISPTLGSRRE